MKSRTIIIILLFCIASLLVLLGIISASWQSPGVNYYTNKSIYDCIYDQAHQSMKIISLNHEFDVNYVKNSGQDCINPYFPAIHIKINGERNAWLHVVYTDNQTPELQQFVDSAHQKKYPLVYPFYTLEQDFYDAPLWIYTLFKKPLTFWKGHAYAVIVDYNAKTVQCVGGIGWGFNLSYFSLRPLCVTPFALVLHDWEKDWSVFKAVLPGYISV